MKLIDIYPFGSLIKPTLKSEGKLIQLKEKLITDKYNLLINENKNF